jgi:hypothetical protein
MNENQEMIELAKKYEQVTRHVAASFKKQLELAKAEGNQEEVIKNEIKLGIMRAARGIFSGSYLSVTKIKPEGDWSEL